MAGSLFDDGNTEELREETIDALTEAYAEDLLTTEDFERRVASANMADSARELRTILAAIPTAAPARRSPRETTPAAEGEDTVFAILSSRTYYPPASGTGVASTITFLGSLVVDLRDVALRPDPVSVSIVSIMGDVKILLPAGASVDNRMVTLLADVKDKTRSGKRRGRRGDAGPRIRLEGVCLMSDVKIVAQ
ncbi:MAG: hypothetical protein ACLFO1_09650 [Spirochaetaceae bacterium]